MRTPERILRQDPPTDGMEKAIEAFRFSPGRERAARRAWPALAGLATALSIGGLALRLSAPTAEASPLARIAQAERDAPRYALTIRNEENRVWLRIWREGVRSRMTFDPGDPKFHETGYDGKRMWTIMGDPGVAVVQSDLTPFRPPLQKIEEYRGRIVRNEKNDDGSRILVIQRAASSTSILQRDTIRTDSSYRPIRVVHEYFRKGRWTFGGSEVRDYTSPIAPETFAFHPPKGFEVYDIDGGRARLTEGLKNGPTRTMSGVTVRLAGVLQDRSGTLTVVYSGGGTPLPDAPALARWNGGTYPGAAVVGTAPDPRAGKPIGIDGMRFPGRVFRATKGTLIAATTEPYVRIGGVDVRLLIFKLPKLPRNSARRLRLTLPVVANGLVRTVGSVRGTGISKGGATFDTTTIPSFGGEEIYRLPNVKRSGYAIGLRRP